MTPVEELNTTISKITEKLPNDPLYHAFTSLFLQSIPIRSLNDFTTDDLVSFVSDRFSFFKSCTLENITIHFDTEKNNERTYLEVVTRDAMFLLVTIENILMDHEIEIIKLFHPTLQIGLDKKGNVNEISKATLGENLVTCIYIEFDKKLPKSLCNTLEKALYEKILAVDLAQTYHEKMIQQLMDVKLLVDKQTVPLQEFHQEWVDLLDWLKNYNYSFFGSCSYTHTISGKKHSVSFDKNSGMGILSKEFSAENSSQLLDTLTAHVERLKDYRSPFLFDTIHFVSPIQRFENLMRLSLKIPVSKTETVEYIFLGLLKRSSLLVKNLETPIIRKKMQKIFDFKLMLPSSYDFNQTIRLFTSTPKFELFRTPTEHLLRMIDDLLSVTNPNEIFCFTRPQIDTTKEFIMVVIPPKLFTKENIQTVIDYIEKKVDLPVYEVIKARGDLQCRLHIYLDVSSTKISFNIEEIEQAIRNLIKPWDDRFKNVLIQEFGHAKGITLWNTYTNAIPNHHKVRRTPEECVRDVSILETLQKDKQIQFNLAPFISKDSILFGTASILFIYNEEKIDLLKMMSILKNLGIHVFDEITTRIGSRNHVIAYIHQFRVSHIDETKMNEEDHIQTLLPLLKQIFLGYASNDPLNALAVKASFTWKQISIFLMYREFMAQIESPHSKDSITSALLKHANSTKILLAYFEQKFTPVHSVSKDNRDKLLQSLEQSFIDSLATVDEIAEDLVLRNVFTIIKNTLRTNYFIPKPDHQPTLSMKLDSKKLTMPQPVPYREIFVYDPEMEGTHLRFGPVARGGLRWSNRHSDFRKEVLGLVKTQQTKNVVIVPVGSKGGFVIKKDYTHEQAAEESVKQYKKFINALLDITDTIDISGKVIHPQNVVDHDGEDPYLVVAADKGTATFSDLANEISEEHGFWLGDAFASGGSVGYNHKEVGITAKGGWECVKLHFLEKGIDIQNEPFTVCGIGDMSGDVFGNGMLLSKYIRLQAAFNHIHIFLDPNPDPKKSWEERDRLFNLPRSTWRDYNDNLISKGGGIFDRKAKEIRLTPEIKALLKINKDVVNGEELISFILKMNVDLLWFGGIGTYIKSPNQTNYDVGDPANDSVRINSTECNAKVIGEGANLGITQVARIELSEQNIQINTDFIDNSAGVNMSDYEVNIKILLKRLLEEKHIPSMEKRNTLLADATDEVADLVLENNEGQHQLLSMDQIRSKHNFSIFNKLIQYLISSKILDPITESIPSQNQLDSYADAKASLPRPLLAVLQSYVKMEVFENLVKTDFIKNPFLDTLYASYFPELLLKKFSKHIHSHRLKSEILATLITNKIINQAGICFFFQAEQSTGKSVAEIAQTYLVIESCLNIDAIRQHVLDAPMSYNDKYQLLISIEKTLQHILINILYLPKLPEMASLEKQLSSTVERLAQSINRTNKTYKGALKKLTSLGFDTAVASQIADIDHYVSLSDLLHLSQTDHADLETNLILLEDVDNLFNFEWLKSCIDQQLPTSQWENSQQEVLLQTIRFQKFNIINYLLNEVDSKTLKTMKQSALLEFLTEKFPSPISLYFQTLQQLKTSGTINLTSLTVTINRLNFL